MACKVFQLKYLALKQSSLHTSLWAKYTGLQLWGGGAEGSRCQPIRMQCPVFSALFFSASLSLGLFKGATLEERAVIHVPIILFSPPPPPIFRQSNDITLLSRSLFRSYRTVRTVQYTTAASSALRGHSIRQFR
jgi:hypothetical protein